MNEPTTEEALQVDKVLKAIGSKRIELSAFKKIANNEKIESYIKGLELIKESTTQYPAYAGVVIENWVELSKIGHEILLKDGGLKAYLDNKNTIQKLNVSATKSTIEAVEISKEANRISNTATKFSRAAFWVAVGSLIASIISIVITIYNHK